MNWIISSVLMFISSIVLYLLVRKSSLEKVPTQVNNLAMFLPPVFIFSLIAFTSHANLRVTFYQFVIIVILSYFFSYLGNKFSLQSIKYSPNPGYSLVLSKSYVVFTTVASLFLFQSELTLKSVTAIILIIIFSALIALSGKSKKNEQTDPRWLPLALAAFFAWGMLALTSKYLLTIGVGILPRLIYSMIIVSALIFLDIRKSKIELFKMSRRHWVLFALIGISGSAFNYFMQLGFELAPNIGYINAINAASIAGVTVFSAILFKDDLSLKKMIGVGGTIVGLILLVI